MSARKTVRKSWQAEVAASGGVMGETKGPYNAEFPEGSTVRVKSREFLEDVKSLNQRNKTYVC